MSCTAIRPVGSKKTCQDRVLSMTSQLVSLGSLKKRQRKERKKKESTPLRSRQLRQWWQPHRRTIKIKQDVQNRTAPITRCHVLTRMKSPESLESSLKAYYCFI